MTELTDLEKEARLNTLKKEAEDRGITFSPNIGYETLLKKVQEHDAKVEAEMTKNEPETTVDKPKVEVAKTAGEIAEDVRKDATKLIRVRISLLNTEKQEMKGEFISAGNSLIGFVKKFIPYDEEFYVNGYHVPQIVLDVLKEKRFRKKGYKMVNGVREPSIETVPEFHIEVLEPLTEDQLAALAREQAAEQRI